MPLLQIDRFRAIVLAVLFGVAALVASAPRFELGQNRYLPFFNLQARAFLEGRVDLPLGADWTHDVITTQDGKKYGALPPLVGFVLVPFVAVAGDGFSERYLTLGIFAAFLLVISAYLDAFAGLRSRTEYALWMSFFALGTGILTCTAVSTPWFSAVLLSSLLLSLALLVHLKARTLGHHVLAVALVCVAATGRTHVILASVPFILEPWFRKHRGDRKALLLLGIPPVCFLLYFGWWNWVRWHELLNLRYREHGYGAFFGENISRYGFTHWRYVFLHLYHGLFGLPSPTLTFPYFRPDESGNGLFAISPLFLFLFFARRRYEAADRFALGCALLVAIPVFTHFSTGWKQFGYRYSLDFLPFLLFLLVRSELKVTSRLAVALIVISLWYNIWGTLIDVGFKLA